MTHSAQIERISALAELERLGWTWEAAGEDEVRLRCPAHEDANPSASLNVKKNLWRCNVPSCAAKGDIVTFVAFALKADRRVVLLEMSSRYVLDDETSIDSQSVERFHSKLWEAGPLLQALRDRGVTDEACRVARLGYHDGRITIPVIDAAGRTMDVLRYLPGAPSSRKMRHTRGHSKSRLYRVADLAMDRVWFCGGPIKSLVVGTLLAPHGIGAVSSTGGEGSWDPSWGARFAGKKVWVCMDVDAAGVAASRKVADHLAPHAAQVLTIRLPLDRGKYPKGDVNDLVGGEGAGAQALMALMDSARQHEPSDLPSVAFVAEHGNRLVDFADLTRPDNIGWRLEVECVVVAVEETPFLLPRDVRVQCDRAQPNCHACSAWRMEPDDRGGVMITVGASSQAIVSLSNAGLDAQQVILREAFGIPRCRSVKFSAVNHRAVREARISPQLSMVSTSNGTSSQPALVVDSPIEISTPYSARGKIYPHPSNQRAILVVDEVDEAGDSLATFEATAEELASLKFFRPSDWSLPSVEDRLRAAYEDLEANVTRIYGRRDLHLVIDLAYHSPLEVSVGRRSIPGWLCALVVGDTAQGKSETTMKMMEHYGLGERVDCKNATVAGLLGGVQQVGSKWFVTWGIIPMHDRRLVILEELKGASVEVLAKLTEVRSSGVAQIPKIERRKASARTRLIMVSNPRSGRAMSSYSFGVEALKELMGAPEDLRRVDVAIGLSAGTVPDEVVYSKPDVEHSHTSELCRRLILWAWTRGSGGAYLDSEALEELTAARDEMLERYCDAIPLVDAGTIEHKLAKLSAAAAARTFSADADGRVRTRRCHVQLARALLLRLYDDPAVKYGQFSQARRRSTTMVDRASVVEYMRRIPNGADLARSMHGADLVTLQDVQDSSGLDRDGAQSVVSFLVRARCVRRVTQGGSYAKNKEFVALLGDLSSGAATLEPVKENM